MNQTKQINPKQLFFSNRMVKALDGIFEYSLTVVEAPMGYGKTTAVREYLNRAGVQVLWHSIYDGATAIFWSGLSKLFAELDGTCFLNFAHLSLPDDSVSRQEALELIKGIPLPGKSVLVLDDYHLIQNPDIHDFIIFLVRNRITNLHIVLITRMASLEPLDELKLKGYAHHITKETFELTPDEIVTYYKLCGIVLKSGQTDMLYEYTEGWISALYLLMLNFIKEGSFEPNEPILSDSLIPNIYSLVEKAIYAPLSEEQKEFLLQASIFDSFSLEQAEYIRQEPDTAQLLAKILARNAFLTYDPKIKIYHLHNILINYLRDQFAKTNTPYQYDLYRKAGEWYLRTGAYLEAMECFYRCRDFGRLLEALEINKAESVDGEHKEMLMKYFDDCSREMLANHPAALGFIGRRMFLFNDREQYARVCREFQNCIVTGEKSLDGRQKNKLLGEYERMMSQTTFNDIAEMARHHRIACELLKGIDSAVDLTETWSLHGAPSGVYLFYRESGQLEQAVADGMAAMSYYGDVTGDAKQAGGYILAAERHFQMGEFENAEIIIHQVFHAGNPQYHPGMMVRGLFLQAWLAFIKGDFATVLSILGRLQKNIRARKSYSFMHTLDLCEAYFYALLGRKDEIPAWISAGEFKRTRLFFPLMGFVNLVYGRVLLIHGEYAKLIGNADHFNKVASFYPNMLALIHTQIQLAAAYWQVNRKDEALSLLQQALDLAMPDRVVMPFVENCDYIQTILEEIYKNGLYREDIPKILAINGTWRRANQQILEEYFPPEKPKLTGRELEIARLAAAGLTNKEIGEQLFISENTVKAALKGIYSKFSINNRTLLGRCLDNLHS
ncbi:MAG TPA: helix-turn-helix transcriptional regulator [Firmicutes bacterium]|jgi:LuxR family transcriptional regulator, maltose regulon positive regulatory protein|nr:helix-turn-helix transcriptional regulator [Bacillota bacterium]